MIKEKDTFSINILNKYKDREFKKLVKKIEKKNIETDYYVVKPPKGGYGGGGFYIDEGVVIVISLSCLILGKIFGGFFSKFGEDLYEKFKEVLFSRKEMIKKNNESLEKNENKDGVTIIVYIDREDAMQALQFILPINLKKEEFYKSINEIDDFINNLKTEVDINKGNHLVVKYLNNKWEIKSREDFPD